MEAISVTEIKARFSQVLARVARGETVLVVRRGRVVARIAPAGGVIPGTEASHLEALEREGLLRRAARPPDPEVLESPRPSLPRGKGLLGALLAEREDGR
ncbi:MAG: type II toxin-antitoxin system prevent-host-death family antitoxin [Planctomycetes bacterium]|nr:type II toxin-antitoxin system prevent-host-death family antitoxin [Planctomycetota bacterium]